MTTNARNHETSEENSAIFFRRIKRSLGIPSTKSLTQLVGYVLSRVNAGLNPDQSSRLMAVLPQGLQGLAVEEQAARRPIRHLDELVEAVYEADRSSGKSVLSTEVRAIEAVVVILRELDRYLDLFRHGFFQARVVENVRTA